jgi:hypothetical protein
MFARILSALLPTRRRLLLLSPLAGLLLVPNCTKSEDTEPFVPASEGATQPEGGGALLTEEEACPRLAAALTKARRQLDCSGPELPECPGFLRPAGGNGCYEYSQKSVEACERAYEDAFSCQSLAPCIVTAQRNDSLPSCVSEGETGAGGISAMGGADFGGAPPVPEGGAPAEGGAAGASVDLGGAPSGGAPG